MNARHLGTPVPLAILAVLALSLCFPDSNASAARETHQPPTRGSLVQLPKTKGCVVDRSVKGSGCSTARALMEPGPFMGSRAIQTSPDGRNLYVASFGSDAVTVFSRNRRTGALRQLKGTNGCIAARGAYGCATGAGLDGPNSITVSPDGRNVYATSRDSSSITTFRRNRKTGALTQLGAGKGCTSDSALPRCTAGRALGGADVVTVSPDGKNVYVGSFVESTVAVFDRNRKTGVLTQPADTTGCLTEVATTGCSTGIALGSPEGMAVSPDGTSVYVATATSNAVVVLVRDRSTGALTQASDGSGCIVNAALAGCTTGSQIDGANALAVSPEDNNVYVTSLLSDSVTAFTRNTTNGSLLQMNGRKSCSIWLGGSGCATGRATREPEGLAISHDGASMYVAGYGSGSIAVFNRNRSLGTIFQKSGVDGCITSGSVANCARGRNLQGMSSIVISPDGRYVYGTAAKSNAIDIFRRVTGSSSR